MIFRIAPKKKKKRVYRFGYFISHFCFKSSYRPISLNINVLFEFKYIIKYLETYAFI